MGTFRPAWNWLVGGLRGDKGWAKALWNYAGMTNCTNAISEVVLAVYTSIATVQSDTLVDHVVHSLAQSKDSHSSGVHFCIVLQALLFMDMWYVTGMQRGCNGAGNIQMF